MVRQHDKTEEPEDVEEDVNKTWDCIRRRRLTQVRTQSARVRRTDIRNIQSKESRRVI